MSLNDDEETKCTNVQYIKYNNNTLGKLTFKPYLNMLKNARQLVAI